MRLSRTDPGALVGSVLAHCIIVAAGAWILSRRVEPPEAPTMVDVIVEPAPPVAGKGSSLAAGPSTGVDEKVRDEAPPIVPGGGEHLARPDTTRSGHGGSVEGERASNLSSSVDPITLERDPNNHLRSSEVQRLRTSRERRSLDDRRATPHPMELSFVASGPGREALRRPIARSNPNQGAWNGTIPNRAGSAAGVPRDEELGHELLQGAAERGAEPSPALGAPRSPIGPDARVSANVMTARPLVPGARAAVPSGDRDVPRDTVDSQQRVAARVAALLQASTLGGTAESGTGGQPAPNPPGVGAQSGWGAHSSPGGLGNGPGEAPVDPGLQGFTRHVLQELGRALRDTFPRWAIAEGRGGLVVFDLTLREDGRIASVFVVRPSGIDEYDRNVIHAVRSLHGFGRVPPGARSVLRISWDSRNPAVARSGPGPGQVRD